MKLEKIRSEASDKIDSLEFPESIRTPGRTWTRYPEIEVKSSDLEPEIESSGDVEVLQGEEAVKAAGERLFDAVKFDEDRLTALHAANLNSVVYIRSKGKASVDIRYSGEGDSFTHVVVEADEGSELDFTEEFHTEGVVTSVDEIYVGENATVRYGSVEASDSELSYSRRKAVVEDYGSIHWLNSQFEGKLNRTKVETVLKGDGSETEKLAIWYPTGEQHNDISMHAYHRGENTRCQMDSRAVVDDEARSVYEGLQHVGDRADDTQSFQDENVLILSDRAEVDASPKLMIHDPNVEASHAASAGNIPEKEMHYMQSRGIDKTGTRKLIVKGYFEPVLGEIELPELKESVRKQISQKL